MKLLESGKLWPYGVGIAITCVFGFCVATVVVTSRADIQESDAYMTNYQDADAKANDLIKTRIAFDKKFKLKYETAKLSEDGCDVKYSLTTVDGKPVKDAKMVLAISRPEINTFNKTVKNPMIKNNLYVFNDVKFPKAGVWNLILKVNIGDYSRFYDIKTDTRINHDRSVQEASTY